MYTSFYHLTAKPFQISTDPRFLWFGEKHREAMANLKYGLLDRNGFIVLTGDVGTGKTTLINALVDTLDGHVRVVKINHPSLEINEFLALVAKTLDPLVAAADKSDLLLFFDRFLQKAHTDGEVVLLIVDEAHRLSMDLLEEIRLLSNIERAGEKLLSIILVGQNEIKAKLRAPQCRALRQRITSLYDIQALSKEETRQYMGHRLKVSGTQRPLFTSVAIDEVYAISQGNPRVINILCDRALLTGYVKECMTINADIITECGRELDWGAQANNVKQPGLAAKMAPHWRALSAAFTSGAAFANIRVRTILKRAKSGCHASVDRMRPTSKAMLNYMGEITAHFIQKGRKKFLPALVAISVAGLVISVAMDLFSEGKVQKFSSAGPMEQKETGPVATALPMSSGDALRTASAPGLAPLPEIGMTASQKVPMALKPTPVELAAVALAQHNNLKAIELLEAYQNGQGDEMPKIAELYAKALVGRSKEMMASSPSEAEALLLKAVDVAPNQADAYLMLGKRFTRIEQYARAIKAYQQVVRINPRASDAFFNLGFLYASTDQFEAAEKAFEQVVHLKPSYLNKALFNLAVVQSKLGNNEASIANLEAVVAMEPQNEKALAFLSQLRIASPTQNAVYNR
jgi:type II secretory pathway predicted ATPase ExeA/Tfp pilus assembly protein PilF